MLEEILTVKTVDTNVDVDNWEDAISHAGRLLVDANYAEEEYIENMVDIVKEFGPYIVILPGVALAHARPEMGAKKIGLSLVTLKNPIEFGNETFDPVKLVFALCATDNHSHLELLREIAVIFEDEEKMLALADCQSKEELINEIYKRIDESKNKKIVSE